MQHPSLPFPKAMSLVHVLLLRVTAAMPSVLEQLFVLAGLPPSLYYSMHLALTLMSPCASCIGDWILCRKRIHCDSDGT
jgi:hypothetical protein